MLASSNAFSAPKKRISAKTSSVLFADSGALNQIQGAGLDHHAKSEASFIA
jgi:hypothetical protein